MKNWIRHFLGLDEVITQLRALRDLRVSDRNEINALKGQITAANRGMGRLIAKLDPNYGRDELDPAVRAESDRISDAVIRRLIAEHVESNRMNTGD